MSEWRVGFDRWRKRAEQARGFLQAIVDAHDEGWPINDTDVNGIRAWLADNRWDGTDAEEA